MDKGTVASPPGPVPAPWSPRESVPPGRSRRHSYPDVKEAHRALGLPCSRHSDAAFWLENRGGQRPKSQGQSRPRPPTVKQPAKFSPSGLAQPSESAAAGPTAATAARGRGSWCTSFWRGWSVWVFFGRLGWGGRLTLVLALLGRCRGHLIDG